MPTPRVTMNKLRHTLQLLHGGTLSTRQIGAALGISKSTVSEIASYARVAGVDWTLAQALSDEELQARLYRPPVARQSQHLEPEVIDAPEQKAQADDDGWIEDYESTEAGQ